MIIQRLTRLVAFSAGLVLLFLACVTWRVSPANLRTFHIPAQLLLTTSYTPDYLSNPSSFWPSSIPLCILGVLLLRYSMMSGAGDRFTGTVEPDSLGISTLIMLTTLSIGTYLTLYIFEQKRLLNTTAATITFVVTSALFILFTCKGSRRRPHASFSISTSEWFLLGLATIALCAMYAFDLNSWKYSFIGDEYAFLWTAQIMLQPNEHFLWLEASGVYSGFPVITTALQTATMKFFGDNNFGWRMSCVIATAACLTPLYVLLRWISLSVCTTPRLCAALGCVLFFTLEPTQIWAKIGKPHAFFLPPILFSLGALAWAQATSRLAWYAIAGFIAGIGCFLSPVGPSLAIGSAVLLQFFFALQACHEGKGRFLHYLLAPGALFFLGLLIGAAPIAVQQDYWEGLSRLNLESEEARNHRPLRMRKTVQSFVAFLSHRNQGHFMFGNPFNLILGMCILAALAVRNTRGLLWLVAGLCLLLGFSLSVGGLSQYGYPPPSRIHLLGIPFGILATLGIAQLLNCCSGMARVVTVALCLFAIPLTIAKITLFNPYQMRLGERAAIIKSVQESESLPVVVLLRDEDVFVEKILTGMMPKEQLIFIRKAESLPRNELDQKLLDAPAGASLVMPATLPNQKSSFDQRFASVNYYNTWDVVSPPASLPLAASKLLAFLKATET